MVESTLLSSVVGYCVYNNGTCAPMVGLTTRHIKKELTQNVVYQAITEGIRAIDTGLSYGNQAEVGDGIQKAIADNVVKREQLFITTKLPDLYHDQVITALQKDLQLLQIDYSDLHLIETPWQHEANTTAIDCKYKTDNDDCPVFHGGTGIPVKKAKPTIQATWKEMENAQNSGLTKNIGVMNFDEDLIMQILAGATIKPVTNQVECHYLLKQTALLKYLRKNNIMVTANTCLPPVPAPSTIINIGKMANRSPQEVMIRYLCQSGIQVVIGATKMIEVICPKRLGFALSGDDMKQIANLNENKRFQYFKTTSVVEHRNYPKSWTKETEFGSANYSHIELATSDSDTS